MITVEQAKLISTAIHLSDIQVLEVVRRYIFDIKGLDVGGIIRPTTILEIQLMHVAFSTASSYYAKK